MRWVQNYKTLESNELLFQDPTEEKVEDGPPSLTGSNLSLVLMEGMGEDCSLVEHDLANLVLAQNHIDAIVDDVLEDSFKKKERAMDEMRFKWIKIIDCCRMIVFF